MQDMSSLPERPVTGDTALEAELCAIIAREFGVTPELVAEASSLRDTPGVESLRLLRAVTAIEKRFCIEVPDEMVFSVETVPQLAGLVRTLQEQSADE